MSARDNILGRIRTSLRRADGDSAQALVRAHIAAHPISPRPAITGDLVAQFRAKSQQLFSTVVEVSSMTAVPAAASRVRARRRVPIFNS